jgi:hypothetical protein
MKKENALVPKQEQLSVSNPQHVMDFAKTLKKFITDNKLSCKIQGKDYVYVDGWKFAGVNFGIIPMAKTPVNLTNDKEVKYSCDCELRRMADDKIVGAGFALCSNKEAKKKSFDEYAIASMAQTRAIAKAYRNLFGFVMTAAGFENTPAEEMEVTPEMKQDIEEVKEQVMLITEEKQLLDYAAELKHLHKIPEFRQLIQKRKAELNKITAQ